MSRNKISLCFGILLIVLPQLGLPSAWKTFLYVVMGLVLIAFALLAHVRRRSAEIHHDAMPGRVVHLPVKDMQ
jgi:hypothetical protein